MNLHVETIEIFGAHRESNRVFVQTVLAGGALLNQLIPFNFNLSAVTLLKSFAFHEIAI